MNSFIQNIQEKTQTLRNEIVNHSSYSKIKDLEGVRVFMQHHIYAVWDFMSLLKSLQSTLTCTSVPWFPVGSPNTRFLINEIVVGEESDVDQHGVRMSHFELYLKAMHQAGASSEDITAFTEKLKSGISIESALNSTSLPQTVKHFLEVTFEVIATGKPHIIAAVFTFGREDLIPGMFMTLVNDLNQRFPNEIETFKYYLDRHIEVDGDHHSHLAMEMVSELCGEDNEKWNEAAIYVEKALKARIELWNGVGHAIEQQQTSLA